MSAPEVKDITFDRPDYTSGAFIVFVGQSSEVAPPGPFWARKAFNKQFVFQGDVHAGSYKLAISYTVPTGKALFVTDVIVENDGTLGGGDPRYPATGYFYQPQIPQVYMNIFMQKRVGATSILLDAIVMHPTVASLSKTYQTPLAIYAGETFRVWAAARLGTGNITIAVMGYETAP